MMEFNAVLLRAALRRRAFITYISEIVADVFLAHGFSYRNKTAIYFYFIFFFFVSRPPKRVSPESFAAVAATDFYFAFFSPRGDRLSEDRNSSRPAAADTALDSRRRQL